MNVEEYQILCNQIVTNPDEAPIIVQRLIEKLTKDGETFQSQTKLLATNEERIRTLQDTNQQLFLKTTAPFQTQNEQKTDENLLGDIVNSFIGE